MSDLSKNEELRMLREEIIRLKGLLARHGIPFVEKTVPDEQATNEYPKQITSQLTPSEKIALFRRLFRGRTNVYPVRWKSAKGKSGYSPACGNEWKPRLCNKRKTKCSDCKNRLLLPVTDRVIYDHLAGQSTVGVYPLLDDNTCFFLAADFDKGDWKEDSRAFVLSCREFDIPAALEISRSGNGAHVWIFFTEAVTAREARQLGMAIISHTCDRIRQLSLTTEV